MAVSTASLIFTGGLGATTVAAGGVLTGMNVFIGGLVYAGVSGVVASALMPKPKMPKMGGGSGLSNVIDPIADFEIVYGETRKGGIKTFLEVNGDNKFMHQFIVLAGHEVNSIGDIYLNDEVVTLDANGFVTSNDYNSKVLIKKFTGSSTQNIGSSLSVPSGSGPSMPSGFRGRGIACLYVRMEYDADVFSNGVPVITAKVQGKKLYDPRKDSTSSAYDSALGVSSHRTNDPSTWQYSDEPALAIRDYLTSSLGLGAKQTAIEDDAIATAISKCASTGVGGAEENSFKIGGVLTTGATPLENLNMLLTTLNGTLFWSQGQWKLVAGAFYTADSSVSGSNAFSYEDILGDISVATRFSRRDTVNTVRGTFVDAGNRYIATDYPEQQIPDLSEDNDEVSTLDLQLPMTTKSAAAQRLAKQVLFVGREQITLSATFKIEKAFAVQVGDTVELTLARYGFSQKSFRVMSWSMEGLGGGVPSINMVLQETSSTAYQWSVSSDEYQAITANNTTLGDASAGLTITNLSATANSLLATDGTAIPRITLDWDNITSPIFDYFLVEYRRTAGGASDFQGIQVRSSNAEITGLVAGAEYEVRVTAFTVKQNSGNTATATVTAVSDTTAPSTPSAPTVTAGVKQLEVQWEGYSFPADFSLMEVHHSTSSGGTFTRVGRVRGTGFVHSGLTQNTTHYYKIKAQDFSGNISAFSAEGSGTVAADVQGQKGEAGSAGARGAGQWHIVVTSLPTTSAQADAAFNIGGGPVDKDQAWFETQDGSGNLTDQNVWLYSSTGDVWNLQENVIVGDLIVDGTITADAIDVQGLRADQITSGQINAETLNIDGTLNLTANDAGFLGGRTATSRYDQDGFYLGREVRGSSTGFEFSTSSVNSDNEITGIIHDDENHLQIYNPKFLSGGDVTTGANYYTSTGTYNLGNGVSLGTVSYTGIGQGGTGGYGLDNGSGSGSGNSGTSTIFQFRRGSATGTVILASQTAAGGSGGANGNRWSDNGTAGQSSSFGAGGAAGLKNNTGNTAGDGKAPAASAYGAGGGGGGGDNASGLDPSGAGGTGGLAGGTASGSIDVSSFNENIYLEITQIGSGASTNTGGDTDGGAGADGVVSISSVLGGTNLLTMPMLMTSMPSGISQSYFDLGTPLQGVTRNRLYHFPLLHGADPNNIDILADFPTGGGRIIVAAIKLDYYASSTNVTPESNGGDTNVYADVSSSTATSGTNIVNDWGATFGNSKNTQCWMYVSAGTTVKSNVSGRRFYGRGFYWNLG